MMTTQSKSASGRTVIGNISLSLDSLPDTF
jgi:hypothetical protein